jgi:hypothetical protein
MRRLRGAPLGLVVVIGGGLVLRLLAMIGYRPAYAEYGDTPAYVATALTDGYVSMVPIRPIGYPAFLDTLHLVSGSMALVAGAQHLLGLVTAVLVYLILRRLAGSVALAVVGAAAVALVPDFVFFEHAVLSESLFLLLVVAAMYAAVAGIDQRFSGSSAKSWVICFSAAGGLLALATMVRVVGEPLVVVFAVCAFAITGSWRERLLSAGAVVLPAAALILIYAAAMSASGGYFGLADGEGWAVYSRMAPVADCNEFEPPSGTAQLCEDYPPELRAGPDFYAWHPASPARAAFIGPPHNDELVGAFGRAALRNQPLDYAAMVATDLWRYVDFDAGPDRPMGTNGSPISDYEFSGTAHALEEGPVTTYYGSRNVVVTGIGRVLGDIQGVVRIHGVLMLVLLIVASAGFIVAHGKERYGILLLGMTALAMLVVPVVTSIYNSRWAIPAEPPLVCAGLIAANALARRFAERRATATPTAEAAATPPG